MLKNDVMSGMKQMFSEENEKFVDNTIVEFRYDLDREEGWRWVPLFVFLSLPAGLFFLKCLKFGMKKMEWKWNCW